MPVPLPVVTAEVFLIQIFVGWILPDFYSHVININDVIVLTNLIMKFTLFPILSSTFPYISFIL